LIVDIIKIKNLFAFFLGVFSLGIEKTAILFIFLFVYRCRYNVLILEDVEGITKGHLCLCFFDKGEDEAQITIVHLHQSGWMDQKVIDLEGGQIIRRSCV
jgi:hypothetical protein